MSRSATLLSVAFLVIIACNSSETEDTAGQQACSRFREVAAGAFGESLSEADVLSGLEDVGRLAEDSTTPAIRDNGTKVGDEANVRALIDGDPNVAQDALADACNTRYPI